MRVRAIYQFGPRVGEYVKSSETNIRVTFAKARIGLIVEQVSIYADIRRSAPEMLLSSDGVVFA